MFTAKKVIMEANKCTDTPYILIHMILIITKLCVHSTGKQKIVISLFAAVRAWKINRHQSYAFQRILSIAFSLFFFLYKQVKDSCKLAKVMANDKRLDTYLYILCSPSVFSILCFPILHIHNGAPLWAVDRLKYFSFTSNWQIFWKLRINVANDYRNRPHE